MLRNVISRVKQEFGWLTSGRRYRTRTEIFLQHCTNEIRQYVSLLEDYEISDGNLRTIEEYLFDHLPKISEDFRRDASYRIFSSLEKEIAKLRNAYAEISLSYFSGVES